MAGATIVVANQKGGVGKTTTSINLAAALAQKRKKTLLVDLDPQGNATLSFVEPDDIEAHRLRAPGRPRPSRPSRRSSPPPEDELDLIGARISLAKAEAKLIGEFDSHFRLKDKLAGIRELYDYVVIDTPPTLGILTVNALVAATHLIVPIQSSYYSLEGTDDLLDTYEKIRARPNPDLQFLGVVITLHDKRTNLARDVARPDPRASSATRSSTPRSPRASGSRRAPPTSRASSASRRTRPARSSTTAFPRRSSAVSNPRASGLPADQAYAPRQPLRRGDHRAQPRRVRSAG